MVAMRIGRCEGAGGSASGILAPGGLAAGF